MVKDCTKAINSESMPASWLDRKSICVSQATAAVPHKPETREQRQRELLSDLARPARAT
jgi:hypothetical protein